MPTRAVFVCTRCSFEQSWLHFGTELVYSLPGDVLVKTRGSSGWCKHCQSVREIEVPFDLNVVVKRIEELRESISSHRPKRRGLLGQLFGKANDDKRKSQIESELMAQESLLLLARGRKSLPRCLECGGEGVVEIEYDSFMAGFSNVLHSCGGYLRRVESADGIRFNGRPTSFLLDSEGRKL